MLSKKELELPVPDKGKSCLFRESYYYVFFDSRILKKFELP